jgi:hypothetical protein
MSSIASTAAVEAVEGLSVTNFGQRPTTDDRRPTTDDRLYYHEYSDLGSIIRGQAVHLVVDGYRILSAHAAQSVTSRGRSDDRNE